MLIKISMVLWREGKEEIKEEKGKRERIQGVGPEGPNRD